MSENHPLIGRYLVVRTYSAGVHAGVLASANGKEVTLTDARRLWYWRGANTLNEVSLTGVTAGSKISEPVAEIHLTEAIELIPATPQSEASNRGAKWAA